MHIKKRISIILLAVFTTCLTCISCSSSKDFNGISDKYLQSLSTPNGYYVDVVIPIKKDKVLILSATLLLYTYEHYYKHYYSSDFLFMDALYKGEIPNIHDHLKGYTTIKIDKSIMKKYRQKGLRYIIDKYLQEDKTGNLTFKDEINFTVSTIMFINNYYLYYDDYKPAHIFTLTLENLAIPID